MRYNDDVINAESWNTDLKKTLHPASPDSQEINHTQGSVPMKTGPSEKTEVPPVTDDQTADENLQISNPELIRFPETNTSTINMRLSGNRINRRKKRGRFLLSGLLTGLFYRSPNIK